MYILYCGRGIRSQSETELRQKITWEGLEYFLLNKLSTVVSTTYLPTAGTRKREQCDRRFSPGLHKPQALSTCTGYPTKVHTFRRRIKQVLPCQRVCGPANEMKAEMRRQHSRGGPLRRRSNLQAQSRPLSQREQRQQRTNSTDSNAQPRVQR
jgi:hypothetical protein